MSVYYSVYRTKDDELVASGTAKECADAMGIQVPSFHSLVSRCRAGTVSRYSIIHEELNFNGKSLSTKTYRYGKHNKPRRLLPPSDEVQMMKLYKQGLNDVKIASVIGRSVTYVRLWRIKNDLPCHGRNVYDHDHINSLFQAGNTASEVRAITGASVSAVREWAIKFKEGSA